jgi:hypothetical protein
MNPNPLKPIRGLRNPTSFSVTRPVKWEIKGGEVALAGLTFFFFGDHDR